MAFHLPKMTWTILNEIEASYSLPTERIIDAVNAWLSRHLSASWEDLVSALRKEKKHRQAEKIRARYCPNMPSQAEAGVDTTIAGDTPPLGQRMLFSPMHTLFTLHRSYCLLTKVTVFPLSTYSSYQPPTATVYRYFQFICCLHSFSTSPSSSNSYSPSSCCSSSCLLCFSI